MNGAKPPVSHRAYWRFGDAPGFRNFIEVGDLNLDLGGSIPDVTVAYQTWGTLNPGHDNAVLVLHALTGDSHVSGPAAPGHLSAGWWPNVVGPGKAIDTDEWFVVASNVLGGCQGTTGPSSLAPDGRAWGSRWPRTTIRDQVDVETRLADHLGINRFAAIIGGSMGGLRALEWLIGYPERVSAAATIACGAVASADQIATQTIQVQAITSDPNWIAGDYYDSDAGPPTVGMGIARRVAHMTYRSENELAVRFANNAQEGEDAFSELIPGVHRGAGRFAVTSYLDHQAARLEERFDAGTYVALSDAMSTHDVGRGRGGSAAALGSIAVPVVVGGIDSDRLYPLYLQQELADAIPTASTLHAIHSNYGHDGFLIEADAVGRLISETLDLARQ